MLVLGVGTAVTSASTGGIATVNEVTARASLALPEASVTVIVQFEYVVPSLRALNVIVLLVGEAEEVELLQPPAYVIVPDSFVLKV